MLEEAVLVLVATQVVREGDGEAQLFILFAQEKALLLRTWVLRETAGLLVRRARPLHQLVFKLQHVERGLEIAERVRLHQLHLLQQARCALLASLLLWTGLLDLGRRSGGHAAVVVVCVWSNLQWHPRQFNRRR